LFFDEEAAQCLNVKTNEKWGLFDSHVSTVVSHDECCDAGKNNSEDKEVLEDAEKLVKACPVETKYVCENPSTPATCTKTDTTFDAHGFELGPGGSDKQTATEDSSFDGASEAGKAILCAYAIGDNWNQSDRTALCEEPTVTPLDN
jgi:hypothetical protein